MDGHGYLLTSNSRSAAPDYIPSLVGLDTVNPNGSDVYFERIDIAGITITSLSYSKWVDPDGIAILGVKAGSKSFYIPHTELIDIATSADDRPTLEMLKALKRQRVLS